MNARNFDKLMIEQTAALSVICTIPVYIYIVISVIAAGYGVWMLWRA